MSSKKFRAKACAYCARPGSSTDAEHVLARAFLPIPDRANTPKVPACRACNAAKEQVEDYARTMVLVGARHDNALNFLKENLEQRARSRPNHVLALGRSAERAWEQTGSGIALPTVAFQVDTATMLDFYGYLTKGLYHHHVGKPLDPQAQIFSRMLPVDQEAVFLADMTSALGPHLQHVSDDIGRGVLRYRGVISTAVPGITSWQIDLAGVRWAVGATTPRTLVSRMHVSTTLLALPEAAAGHRDAASYA
ncbi:hypothetical protein [Methylobacterium sp. B1]|uniref:HNH endonuclease n=1 Tax=Methylobacterium sp. B1 TaxID=91459 RepID=UPI0011D241A2|nr:hypothetical protein [Methylobacterium sp. B1]